MESNEGEDNEEREGDFYSHAHTGSFLLGSSPLWHGKFWQTNVTREMAPVARLAIRIDT
jgi:hypothetical protein